MKRIDPVECACTGVRWCARCLHPAVRERRRMPAPLPPPPLLGEAARPSSQPVDALPVDLDRDRVHAFDLVSQSVPTLPDFRGVRVFENLLEEEEARSLLETIETRPFLPSQSGREKQHFGARVNFNKRRMNVRRFEGLPDYAPRLLQLLAERIAEEARSDVHLANAHGAFRLTDVFVLRYAAERRSNLDLHLDDIHAYGELILDLSLESDSVLTFYRGRAGGEVQTEPSRKVEPACVRVPLPAGSIAAIYGPARYAWEHGILANDVSRRRTSITLRTLSPELHDTADGRWLLNACRPYTDQRKAARADAS